MSGKLIILVLCEKTGFCVPLTESANSLDEQQLRQRLQIFLG